MGYSTQSITRSTALSDVVNKTSNHTVANISKYLAETLTNATNATLHSNTTHTTASHHTAGPSPLSNESKAPSIASAIINSTKTLFGEPTKMVKPVEASGVDHWTLMLGFGFLFAVSIGCVYFVIRCLRGDGKHPGDHGPSLAASAPQSETSRLIPVVTNATTTATEDQQSSGSAISASRQRFLDQRRQQVQQQTYGATA
jgi:hypothetical protein